MKWMGKRVMYLRNGKIDRIEGKVDLEARVVDGRLVVSDRGVILFKVEETRDGRVITGLNSRVYGFGSDGRSFRRNGLEVESRGAMGLAVSRYGVLSLYSPEEMKVSVSTDGDVLEISPSVDLFISFSKDFDSVRDVLSGVNRIKADGKNTLEVLNGSISGYVPPKPDGLDEDFWRDHVERVLRSGDLVLRPLFSVFPDRLSFEIWDQFVLEDGLMVAPIGVEGVIGRFVYLPRGRWMLLETGETLLPGVRFVEGEDPLIFLREDSMFYRFDGDRVSVWVYLKEKVSRTLSVGSRRWTVRVDRSSIKVEVDPRTGDRVEWIFSVRAEDFLKEVSFTVEDEREVNLA